MPLSDLPTLAEMQALRAGKPIPKPKTRLEERIEARPLTKVDDKAFKDEVWKRDKQRCRCCGRKVERIMGRVPERGEVHHLHGRRGDLRFEDKAAILVCLRCHERLTGRVNEKWIVVTVAAVWWFVTKSDGHRYIDARKPLQFRRAA